MTMPRIRKVVEMHPVQEGCTVHLGDPAETTNALLNEQNALIYRFCNVTKRSLMLLQEFFCLVDFGR